MIEIDEIRTEELHQQAMELAERADIARMLDDLDLADELISQAFELEAEAARLIADDLLYEPTRSVYHRSAASLALECGKLREAEKLIAAALAGEPPFEIAEELRDLLEQVNFQRHLELRGVDLNPEELQMSIAGDAVGFGIALSDVVIQRIRDLEKIIYRTAERLQGKAYRDAGPVTKSISRSFGIYMSTPRAGSFAVTLRIGEPSQPILPGFGDTFYDTKVLDEVLDCLALLEASEHDILEQKIANQSYYTNFVGLARNVAPDGGNVKMVGFTAARGRHERKVSLTRRQDEISLTIAEEAEETDQLSSGEYRKPVTIVGQLLYADEMEANEVKVKDDQGKPHTIIVPEGMMSDIVRPLWKEWVEITGFYVGKKIRLSDIRRAAG